MDESWLTGLTALVCQTPTVWGGRWYGIAPGDLPDMDWCRDVAEIGRALSMACAPMGDRMLKLPCGPFWDVRDGVIEAEWWCGGRFPVVGEVSLPRERWQER